MDSVPIPKNMNNLKTPLTISRYRRNTRNHRCLWFGVYTLDRVNGYVVVAREKDDFRNVKNITTTSFAPI